MMKRKRSIAKDSFDLSPSRPLADVSNSSLAKDRNPHPSPLSPPRGPRGAHREIHSVGQQMSRENDRVVYSEETSKTSGSRHFTDELRDRDREPDRTIMQASTYRPQYSEKARATLYPSAKGNHPRSFSLPEERLNDADDHHSAAALELTSLFTKLIDEATNVATLKIQQSTAEKFLRKRNDEFSKSKSQHEKFPSTEEAQRRAKELAAKDCKVISEKLRGTQDTLEQLASGAVAAILPRLLPAHLRPNSDELQKVQAQHQDLEARYQLLQRQVDEQRQFVEAERAYRLQLEKSHTTLESKTIILENVQKEDIATSKELKRDILQNREIIRKIDKDSTELMTIVRGNGNSKTPGLQENLNQLMQKYNSLRSEFSEIKTGIGPLKSLELQIKDVQARDQGVQHAELDKLYKSMRGLEDRVKALDARPAISSDINSFKEAESRLLRLESEFQDLPTRIGQVSADLADFRAQQEAADDINGTEIDAVKSNCNNMELQLALVLGKTNDLEASVASRINAIEVSAANTASQHVSQHGKPAKEQLPTAMDAAASLVGHLDQKMASALAQVSDRFHNLDQRIESNTLGLTSLDARYQALNTRDMALHMISVLNESYPNVRDCQGQLIAFDKGMQAINARLIELDASYEKLQSQIKAVEERPQPLANQILATAPLENTRASQSMRSEVDTLTRSLAKEVSNLKTLIAEEVSMLKKVTSNSVSVIEALKRQVDKDKATVGDELAQLHITVDDLKESDFAEVVAKLENMAVSLEQIRTEVFRPVLANADGNKKRKLSGNRSATPGFIMNGVGNGPMNGGTLPERNGSGQHPTTEDI